MDRGDHAGRDRQRLFAGAEAVAVGAHADEVEGFALVVGDRVGRHRFQFAIEAAVDGVVVGGDLDLRRLPGTQEGDVGRAYPGLDEQAVLDRHDFHDVAAGLDDAADGGDLDRLDDAVDRRTHRRSFEAVSHRDV